VGRDGHAVPDRGRRPSGSGPGAETKEGVTLGGAHCKMRDDDEPGPLTQVSAPGADETAPRAPARPTY